MFKSTLNKRKKALKPIPQEAFERIVKNEILHATDFVTSSLVNGRVLADKYYQGETRLPHEPGRSGVIVTCVRDGVRSVVPSMARIFTQSDTVAEFSSDDEEDEQICQQMTLYVNSVYDRFGGYEALIQGCTDALKARIGVVKVSLEKKVISSHKSDIVVPLADMETMEEDDNSQVTEVSEPFDGEDGSPMVQAVQTRQNIRKVWHFDLVPPENFIVNASATCLEDARIIGTVEIMRIYDAALMGIDPAELIELRGSTDESAMSDYEKNERTTYIVNQNEPDADDKDPMSDDITIAEIWLRIDADGDGVAELRHIITGGSEYKILLDEPVNFVPLGIFKTDLQPHVFFPISLAEDLMQDQDAQTALLRSIIDNAALTNNPQRAFNETMVNADDMKNSEIGALIRTKGPGQIEELVTPFVAGQTLPVLQYLEDVSEKRSGISKMSQGLDPDALQSTTKIAANAAVMGADARMEMMARNAGETGIKSMFLAIVRIAMNELRGPQSLKTMTGYQDVLPDIWHDQVAVSVNVGLGNGRIDSKIMALTAVAAVQQQAIMTLGMSNPVCGWEQFRNTQKQLLRLAGEKSINPYFPRVDPQVLQQLDKQQQDAAAAAQQQPGAPDVVGAAKAKAEADLQINAAKLQQEGQIKSSEMQLKGQLESAQLIQKGQITDKQLQAKLQSDMVKASLDDDRARDKQDADFAVQSKKVELDNVTKQQVAAEQAKARTMPGSNGRARPQ